MTAAACRGALLAPGIWVSPPPQAVRNTKTAHVPLRNKEILIESSNGIFAAAQLSYHWINAVVRLL
jgi:hypothetical protein